MQLNLTERVKEILAEELNVGSVGDSAKQEDYAEWDSLTYMRVVAAVESSFNIDITAENINKFNSVENIVKEIAKAHDHR